MHKPVSILLSFSFCLAVSAAPPAQSESTPVTLSSQVEAFDSEWLIGKWKADIKGHFRHPLIQIDCCEDGKISGSFHGRMGTFPLTGAFNHNTGELILNVDFSSAKLLKLLNKKSVNGVIYASIETTGKVITGRGYIAELGKREVTWKARKLEN